MTTRSGHRYKPLAHIQSKTRPQVQIIPELRERTVAAAELSIRLALARAKDREGVCSINTQRVYARRAFDVAIANMDLFRYRPDFLFTTLTKACELGKCHDEFLSYAQYIGDYIKQHEPQLFNGWLNTRQYTFQLFIDWLNA